MTETRRYYENIVEQCERADEILWDSLRELQLRRAQIQSESEDAQRHLDEGLYE